MVGRLGVEGKRVKATIPMKGMRKAIAEHMHRSLAISAQLSSTNEVDMTEMIRLRNTLLKKEEEIGIPLPIDIPTIKEIVDCPNCGGKIEVEFEIDMAPIIPMITKGLEQLGKKEGADGKD